MVEGGEVGARDVTDNDAVRSISGSCISGFAGLMPVGCPYGLGFIEKGESLL